MEDTMKRTVITLLLITAAAFFAQAQGFEDAEVKLLEHFGLDAEEIEELQDTRFELEQKIQMAQAEINVYKAELAKLLISNKPDMKQIERLLRESIEWEIQIRLANIRRELAYRQALGDKNYARFVEAVKTMKRRAAEAKQLPRPADPKQPR
jgi:hypothetical protein